MDKTNLEISDLSVETIETLVIGNSDMLYDLALTLKEISNKVRMIDYNPKLEKYEKDEKDLYSKLMHETDIINICIEHARNIQDSIW